MYIYENILSATQKLKNSLIEKVNNCEYYDYDAANRLAVFFLDKLDSAVYEHFDVLEKEIDEYELSRLTELYQKWCQRNNTTGFLQSYTELDSICFWDLPDEAQLYDDDLYIGNLFIAHNNEYYVQMESGAYYDHDL